MRSTREMLSVGIDVGTTTTQVVFSRLKLRNAARVGLVPRIEVDARAVEHVGRVHFTPLLGPDRIDLEGLADLVRAEYAAAGIADDEVETGAVIITGETALRRDADEVLRVLSGLAGDFVVTVAGPNLEAQIAGRGSGAAAWSADNYTTVVNADVGGGSSNVAVFRAGRHLGSAAIMVGGRGVQIDAGSAVVTAITSSARSVIDEIGSPLEVGRPATLTELRALTDALAGLVVDLVVDRPSPLLRTVALSPMLELDLDEPILFLSGGVGRCYAESLPTESVADVASFGDIGPLLARSLRDEPRLRTRSVRAAPETIGATVIGAASQTVTLSGTTIWVRADLLPLRDLPVIEPDVHDVTDDPDGLVDAIVLATRRWDAEGDGRVAIAVDLPTGLEYGQLATVATALDGYARHQLPDGVPLVVVIQEDYAQVLGQTLQSIHPDLPLITIDQIGLGEGDFIDIGRPLLDGRAVPVSVKTLVFTR
ncbi:ethanolamine ammonia-lyase reactivating factor EutA [Nitriliruptor alkaliphilus]|uniref:ethanolamine ammonia-lyase reactivating factor EutA n=1 Tax=Nitriliruptor alkaliphilus TaxID=427918 RepID=UPI0006968D54|nr:ethanolamine ammonia-lyase reactivating factor EutA [Nitriliruptor alkaliphilus]